MNQVALVGNITDDPELRYPRVVPALAGFTVAVSHPSMHNGGLLSPGQQSRQPDRSWSRDGWAPEHDARPAELVIT
jgi:single-stranded DNA-binding protein